MRFSPSPKDNTDPADGLGLGSGIKRAPYIRPLTSKGRGIGLDSVPPEMSEPGAEDIDLLRWLAAELMFLPPGIGLGR